MRIEIYGTAFECNPMTVSRNLRVGRERLRRTITRVRWCAVSRETAADHASCSVREVAHEDVEYRIPVVGDQVACQRREGDGLTVTGDRNECTVSVAGDCPVSRC